MKEHEARQLSLGDKVRYNEGYVAHKYRVMLELSEQFGRRVVRQFNPEFVKLAEERLRKDLRREGFINGLEYEVLGIEEVSISPLNPTVAIEVKVKGRERILNCGYFDKVG